MEPFSIDIRGVPACKAINAASAHTGFEKYAASWIFSSIIFALINRIIFC
jgi:hypothetical protein